MLRSAPGVGITPSRHFGPEISDLLSLGGLATIPTLL